MKKPAPTKKVAGYVDKVAVDIGASVKKGQTLIALRIPELHNAVDQRQALLQQAKAEIAQAQAAELAARAAADTAAAHVKEAEAGVGRAQRIRSAGKRSISESPV